MAWWIGEDFNQISFNWEDDWAMVGAVEDFERGIDV